MFLYFKLQNVTSINFNPNKWLLVNFDCSLLWWVLNTPVNRQNSHVKLTEHKMQYKVNISRLYEAWSLKIKYLYDYFNLPGSVTRTCWLRLWQSIHFICSINTMVSWFFYIKIVFRKLFKRCYDNNDYCINHVQISNFWIYILKRQIHYRPVVV